MVVNRIYKMMDNWVLVAIPMFIFMGLMLDRSGIAEGMMKTMQNLFGKVHGGLAITVTIIGVILAASTGIIGASVVLLGLLSLPVMWRQGYKKTLALGTVAASGTLGILIPPQYHAGDHGGSIGTGRGGSVHGRDLSRSDPGISICRLHLDIWIGQSQVRPSVRGASSFQAPNDPGRLHNHPAPGRTHCGRAGLHLCRDSHANRGQWRGCTGRPCWPGITGG